MDLLQKNAIDSIQLGVEDYFLALQDERRVISSIRNLYSGILLLFKAEIKKRSPPNAADTLIKKYHSLKVHGDIILAKGKGTQTIGLYEFKERFQLVNILIDDEIINKLTKLSELRNSIEHHFTDSPREMLENSILEAFLLLKNFNDKYSSLKKNELFKKENWRKLTEMEKIHDGFKEECVQKWKDINFADIENRIFPVSQEDDIRNKIIIDFFSEINCPRCRSDLIEPLAKNFYKNTEIDMKCMKCDEKFNFGNVIEETLESHYAYEIMKVGAKGGCLPLGICQECELGTFLNYEHICIYCGNEKQGEDDPEFAYELFSRNVNDHWND